MSLCHRCDQTFAALMRYTKEHATEAERSASDIDMAHHIVQRVAGCLHGREACS